MTDLTRDAFLGGRLMLWQPARGYRAGVDAVLLAAACPAQPGQSVLDLGCGTGTAALCLHARIGGLDLTGVERQPALAALARRNSDACGAQMSVVCADVAALPGSVRTQSFHHVICNPPYFDRDASLPSGCEGREIAMGEGTPLATWVDTAARRLRPRGWLTLIHRAERLADLIRLIDGRLGSVCVLPIVPRVGRDASLVILRARKDGRAPLRLMAPFQMHAEAHHMRDEEDYTGPANAVLRQGQALPGV